MLQPTEEEKRRACDSEGAELVKLLLSYTEEKAVGNLFRNTAGGGWLRNLGRTHSASQAPGQKSPLQLNEEIPVPACPQQIEWEWVESPLYLPFLHALLEPAAAAVVFVCCLHRLPFFFILNNLLTPCSKNVKETFILFHKGQQQQHACSSVSLSPSVPSIQIHYHMTYEE